MAKKKVFTPDEMARWDAALEASKALSDTMERMVRESGDRVARLGYALQAARLDAMTGVVPEGEIGIDRKPSTWWRNADRT